MEQSEVKVTNFNDLPNQLILMICRYLKPAEVLEAFLYAPERIYYCILEYHQKIDLTKCSYGDFQYFLKKFNENVLYPFELTVSNARIPTQILTFLNSLDASLASYSTSIRHLNLLDFTQHDFLYIYLFLLKFQSLYWLRIIQSKTDQDADLTNSLINDAFHQTIFNSFLTLTELELLTYNGLILDKQLHPNHNLTHLSISLQNINDLYVLLDGLAPKLYFFGANIRQSIANKEISLPESWPSQSMSKLTIFHLVIKEAVPLAFNQFCNILMPLNELNSLALVTNRSHSDTDLFNEGNRLEMLIEKYLPKLHSFTCLFDTTNNVNMQTLAAISERWPMKCTSNPNVSPWKSLYTVPWPLTDLYISSLADDDTTSICPAVETLIIDKVYSNASAHRFPNVGTLKIEPDCSLPSNDYFEFHRLRDLTMTNINQVPSSVIQRLHTLTLSNIDDLIDHSIIYSNMKDLIIKDNQIDSSILLTILVQQFPRLHLLEIHLAKNDNYYDNLNILLNRKYLPHLIVLKTNWVDKQEYYSNINRWLKTKTNLKWRSTPWYGHCHRNDLTICL